MEIKIKIKLPALEDFKKAISIIKEVEKEHSCNCTLLDVEIG